MPPDSRPYPVRDFLRELRQCLNVCPAIFADILQFRARVLVISGGTSVYGMLVLRPNTPLSALLS